MKLNLKKTILGASVLILLSIAFVGCTKDSCLPQQCSFGDGNVTTNCNGICDDPTFHD